MKPRFSSSKKWTAFPIELNEQIHSVLEEGFRKKLAPGKFIVEGRIYTQEILFRIGFLPEGRLFQANFEASINYNDLENIQDAIDLCLDATASMMEQYYCSNERIDLPRNWSEYSFDSKKLCLQFSSVNSKLESEADKILGLVNDTLVHDEDASDDDDNSNQFAPDSVLDANVSEDTFS
jgi:hypothetical protein